MNDFSLDIRWKQRFNNFQKALLLMGKAIDIIQNHKGNSDELDLQEEGLIKRFEFTWELAWNVMKDYLEYEGFSHDMKGPRSALKEAFRVGLIEDDVSWYNALLCRNLTAHQYDEKQADSIVSSIQDCYYNLFCQFELTMLKLVTKENQ